jgi:hypothetical protein
MRWSVALVLVAACGGGSSSDDPDARPDSAPGDPFAEPAGTILVSEQDGTWNGDPGPASAIAATLSDYHPFQRETARTGECRLLEYQPASCPTPCDGVCTMSGCVAWPTPLDAGTITITGTHDPHELQRDTINGQYWSGALPPELFDAGATITASAAGGADFAAFSLSARAPDPIDADITRPLDLPLADDFDVHWTSAGDTSVRLSLVASNGGHGLPYDAIIECVSPDDGTITVPGAFLSALGHIYGAPCLVGHECPPSTLTRYHAATSPSGVVLRVATEVVFYVRHDAI